jgi:hypothetical protein
LWKRLPAPRTRQDTTSAVELKSTEVEINLAGMRGANILTTISWSRARAPFMQFQPFISRGHVRCRCLRQFFLGYLNDIRGGLVWL